MGKVSLKGIETTAKVGVYNVEHVIGTRCIIDVEITASLKKAGDTDLITNTIDYEVVASVVTSSMQKTYHLLEAAARSIGEELVKKYPEIQKMTISIHKIKPLLKANASEAVIEWQFPEDL